MGAVACRSASSSSTPRHPVDAFPASCKPYTQDSLHKDTSTPLPADIPSLDEAITLITRSTTQYTTGQRELGLITWHRCYPKSYEEARRLGLPIFLLCVGSPGPCTARQYGIRVLSHPLIVDAIMTYFYPLVLLTNGNPICPFGTSAKLHPDPQLTEDLRIIHSFNEKTSANPVIRIIQPIAYVQPHITINDTSITHNNGLTKTSTLHIMDQHEEKEETAPVVCGVMEAVVRTLSSSVPTSTNTSPILTASSTPPASPPATLPMLTSSHSAPSSSRSLSSTLSLSNTNCAIDHGVTICPRLAGNYTVAGLVTHVCAALKLASGGKQRPAMYSLPAYIHLLVAESESTTSYGHLEKITFAMTDPLMGEVMLGSVCGVLSVAAGTCRGHDVVDIDFDPTIITVIQLVEYGRKHDICDIVLARHPYQQTMLEEKIPTQKIIQCTTNTKISNRRFDKIRNSLYRYIPMTIAQSCRINSALATDDVSPLHFLSPSQIALYTIIVQDQIQHAKTIKYRDCVGKDVVDEWIKITSHAPVKH